MAFTFHTDPGHGWLEVPVEHLQKADLSPSDFSGYSYVNGTTVYLEEDCDAEVFIRSWEAHVGPFKAVEKYHPTDHWIRDLDRIVSADELSDEIWF